MSNSSGFDTAVNEPVVPQVPLMRYNQKMYFDGVDDKLNPSAPDLLVSSDWSISAWFVTDSISADQFIMAQTQSANNRIGIHINTSGNIVATMWDGSSYYQKSSTAISVGTMNHVVYANSNKTITLYLNGVAQSGGLSEGVESTTGTTIGCKTGNSMFFNGIIEDMSFFNHTMTSTEAQELFNNGVALDATTHSKKGNLLAYYRNDGVTTWQDRRGWSALDFDGTGDRAENTSFTTHQSDTGTISGWFKFDTVSTQQRFFGVGGSTTTGATRSLEVDGGNIWAINYGSANVQDWNTGASVVVNAWYHLALTWNGSAIVVYVNGVAYSNNSLSLTTPTGTKIQVGGAVWDGQFELNGQAKSASFYTSALSQSEIQSIYNNGINYSEIGNTNLAHYWVMDNETTVKDLVGSNDLTVTDATLNTGNNGSVQGSPDSITIREGLNSNRDGLGFYFTNPSNNVLRLNGIDEHLKLPYTKSFDMGDGSFTVCAWVKTTLGVGDSLKTILWARDNDDSNKGFEFQIDDGSDRPRFILSDGSATECLGTNDSVESNKWHFVAVVVDKENDLAKIFLSESDGSALKCQTTTDISARGNINATPDWYIGKRKNNTSQDFMGIIDELMVYNIALTALESDGTTVEAGDTVTSGKLLKNYKFSKGKHKND